MSDNIDFEEEEEFITPKELIKKIETAWINEISSPDILSYKGEIIELMSGQLSHMEQSLEPLAAGDFRKIVHNMEIERIRYTINSYLRARLHKIENFSKFFLTADQKRPADKKRLSPSEREFAENYVKLMENHFKQLVFRHIPPQQDDPEKRLERPNLMSNVFLKINTPYGTLISSSNDEEVALTEKDSLHMLPYQVVSELLLKGDIDLI